MVRLALLTPALLALAACGAGEDSAATDAPGTAPDGPMFYPGLSQLDPDIATGKIPAVFHGVWDDAAGNCDPGSYKRVKISARQIEYVGKVGHVAGMAGEDGDAIADLVMGTGGQSWGEPTRLSYEITTEGERLQMSDAREPEDPNGLLRKRCPG
jgi:hypothetical protein